jgi:hypothetical protein
MEEEKEEKKEYKFTEKTLLKRAEKKKKTMIRNEIKKKIKKYKTLENNIFYQIEMIKYKKEKRNELFSNVDDIINKILSLIKSKPEIFSTTKGFCLYTKFFDNLMVEYIKRKKCVVNQLEYITFIKELFKQYLDTAKIRRKEMEKKINYSFFDSKSNFDTYTLFSNYYYHVILISAECINELIKINKIISYPSYDIIEHNKNLEKYNKIKKHLYYDLSVNITEFNLKDKTNIPFDIINIIKKYII